VILAHYGTFDVDNYGDLLFPLLLERRMAQRGINCVHISPTGTSSRWVDALSTVSVYDASQLAEPFTFVVLGGGNIFRADATRLTFYALSRIGGSLAYPSLWLSAFSLAHRHQVPLCWNAVGVPRPITNDFAKLVEWGTSLSRYIAVRDRESRENLLASSASGHIHVVPDTALGIRDLWSPTELQKSYTRVFGEMGRAVPERLLVLSVKRKYVTTSDIELASLLDRLARYLRATPMFLALGPCHGDDEISMSVARHMRTAPIIRVPQSLREAAACISQADQYAGSSLHGAITAISFGIPALIVADEAKVSFRKFSGFLHQVGIDNVLFPSWACAETAMYSWKGMPQQISRLDPAFSALEEHWDNLFGALTWSREDHTLQSHRTEGRNSEVQERLKGDGALP
jgi:polysaccharide pyruvyl transferase WcaK-like protein